MTLIKYYIGNALDMNTKIPWAFIRQVYCNDPETHQVFSVSHKEGSHLFRVYTVKFEKAIHLLYFRRNSVTHRQKFVYSF